MYQGSADLAVVVVKLYADENMVTYLRIKRIESVKDDGGKGPNMIIA